MARARTAERGAALLVVMVAVTVLTALAADLAYETQVSLRIAANARDELQATYLAKGGVALSRLLLASQQDVEAAMGSLTSLAGTVPGLQGGIPAIKPQLWRVIAVDSDLASRLFGGGAGGGGAAAKAGGPAPPVTAEAMAAGASPERASAQAGNGFAADIQDEGAKVNAQLDGNAMGGLLGTQVQALYQLVCDARWDALFDQEDANGLRVSRADLLAYLRDWVDQDAQSSSLAAAFPAGGCSMQLTSQAVFEPSFQDENYAYDRGDDRYRTKNARMDSLAELYMVAGVTDAFMAAFGDQLTVYMPRDAKPNLNRTDLPGLLLNARILADAQSLPMLADPVFAQQLQKLVVQRTIGGLLALTSADMVQILEALGVTIDKKAVAPQTPGAPQTSGASALFDDKSTVFRIISRGRTGVVEKTIEVVIRYKPRGPGAPGTVAQPPATAGAPGAGGAAGAAGAAGLAAGNDPMGKLVHWHEE